MYQAKEMMGVIFQSGVIKLLQKKVQDDQSKSASVRLKIDKVQIENANKKHTHIITAQKIFILKKKTKNNFHPFSIWIMFYTV